MPSAAASASTVGRQEREALRGEALGRHRLEERLEPEPADRARPAARRQHVVAAGRVVARGDRRPRPDEDRAGVAHLDPRAPRRRRAARGARARSPRPPRASSTTRQTASWPVLAPARRARARRCAVDSPVAEDDHLGRAARQVDRDVALRPRASPRSRTRCRGRRSCRPARRRRASRSPAVRRAPRPRRYRAARPQRRRDRRRRAACRRRCAARPRPAPGTAHMTSVETRLRGT